jgi:DNA-directed RNA polymerase I subunit RPA43
VADLLRNRTRHTVKMSDETPKKRRKEDKDEDSQKKSKRQKLEKTAKSPTNGMPVPVSKRISTSAVPLPRSPPTQSAPAPSSVRSSQKSNQIQTNGISSSDEISKIKPSRVSMSQVPLPPPINASQLKRDRTDEKVDHSDSKSKEEKKKAKEERRKVKEEKRKAEEEARKTEEGTKEAEEEARRAAEARLAAEDEKKRAKKEKKKAKAEKKRVKEEGKLAKAEKRKSKDIEDESTALPHRVADQPRENTEATTETILAKLSLKGTDTTRTIKRLRQPLPSGVASEPMVIPENSTQTGIHLIKTQMYLRVHPIALRYSVKGAIADSISPLLMSYHAPLKGVVLAHQNARPTEGEGATSRCIDQYGASFLWVTVEVLVFRPSKGAWLRGQISIQTPTHINLVVYNVFNARIEKNKLPADWKFIEEEDEDENDNESPLGGDETAPAKRAVRDRPFRRITGSYYDGAGNKIEGVINFRAIDFDVIRSGGSHRTLISIEGSLRKEDFEKVTEQDGTLPSSRRGQQVGESSSSSRT